MSLQQTKGARAYIAPAGTDPNDPDAWVEIGSVATDGYQADPDTLGPRYELPKSTTKSFKFKTAMSPAVRQLLFGNIAPPATPPYKGLRQAIDRLWGGAPTSARLTNAADMLTAALADTEGRALVQAIHDRKQGTTT